MSDAPAARFAWRVPSMVTCAAALVLLTFAPAMAEEAEYDDFSETATDRCEVIGLAAVPPDGWFTSSMQDMPDQLRGCQMLHVDDDDVLLGIIRLLSVAAGPDLPSDDVRNRLVGLETSIWAQMGIEVGEPIWIRDDVPLRGDGLVGASAIGLSAIISETGLPQEIHVLTFRHEDAATHYVLSLITPREEEAAEVHRSNLQGFSELIGGLERPAGE